MNSSSKVILAGKYRMHVDIIANVVSLTRNGNTPGKIRERARLNASQSRRYLGELARLGLIDKTHVNGRTYYTASQKGDKFLKHYNALRRLL